MSIWSATAALRLGWLAMDEFGWTLKSYTLALFLEEKMKEEVGRGTHEKKKSHCNAGHNHGQQVGGNMTAVKRTEETLAGQRELIEMRERKNRRREQRKGFLFPGCLLGGDGPVYSLSWEAPIPAFSIMPTKEVFQRIKVLKKPKERKKEKEKKKLSAYHFFFTRKPWTPFKS